MTTKCPTPSSTEGSVTLWFKDGNTAKSKMFNKLGSLSAVSDVYAGNVDESLNTCPSRLDLINGEMKYPGLKMFEQNTFDKRLGNYYWDNALTRKWEYLQFNPSYWAGIDCSGLVQRSIEAAKKTWEQGLGLSLPTIPIFSGELYEPNGMDKMSVGSQQFLCDGSVQVEECKWGNSYITAALSRTYNIDVENQKELLLRGDIVGYPENIAHVGIIASERWGKSKYKNTLKTSYDVIHAYGGGPTGHYNEKIPGVAPIFARRVLITGDNFATPNGYGRIKLWD